MREAQKAVMDKRCQCGHLRWHHRRPNGLAPLGSGECALTKSGACDCHKFKAESSLEARLRRGRIRRAKMDDLARAKNPPSPEAIEAGMRVAEKRKARRLLRLAPMIEKAINEAHTALLFAAAGHLGKAKARGEADSLAVAIMRFKEAIRGA